VVAAKPSGGTAGTELTDVHDDVTGLFSPAAGTTSLAASAAYSPYGSASATSGTMPSLGYQGQYTDPSTGDTDMSARWYSPATGTFTSNDTLAGSPAPDTLNPSPYGYADGNPLTNTDATGHQCLTENPFPFPLPPYLRKLLPFTIPPPPPNAVICDNLNGPSASGGLQIIIPGPSCDQDCYAPAGPPPPPQDCYAGPDPSCRPPAAPRSLRDSQYISQSVHDITNPNHVPRGHTIIEAAPTEDQLLELLHIEIAGVGATQGENGGQASGEGSSTDATIGKPATPQAPNPDATGGGNSNRPERFWRRACENHDGQPRQRG
jgi:RHS repeat-associated protein